MLKFSHKDILVVNENGKYVAFTRNGMSPVSVVAEMVEDFGQEFVRATKSPLPDPEWLIGVLAHLDGKNVLEIVDILYGLMERVAGLTDAQEIKKEIEDYFK